MNTRNYAVFVTGTTLAERKPLIHAFKRMGEQLYNGALFEKAIPVYNLYYCNPDWLVSSSSNGRPILTIPQAIAMLSPHHFKEL